MPGHHVVLRLPSQGTLFGNALAHHPGARVTSVPTSTEDVNGGLVLHLLALVEGLPDAEMGALLLAWNRRYGRPATVLGESFVLQLPLTVDQVASPASEVLREGPRLPVLGNVAQADWMEQWYRCRSQAEAEGLAQRLQRSFLGAGDGVVRRAEPRQADADCWEVLRLAGGVETEVLA